MFAFHIMPNGGVDWIGEVKGEKDGLVRLQIIDAIMATGCGLWEITSQIKDVQKIDCNFYLDKMECLETALRRNSVIYRENRQGNAGR